MGEEGTDGFRVRLAPSGMSGFMPGCPLVRKGHGGVALSENLGDPIHSCRELFRLFLGQILAKPRMESPSRLDFFPFDAGHHTDEFNVGAGGPPRRCARGAGGCPGCSRGRLTFEDSRERRKHGGDAEGRSRCHLRVTGSTAFIR